ncbi:MAG TPA: uracil-DNA glycosylase, partial [Candidatus Corynebacterium gallistercoris]|nr:uracil-DNA glycosylase [Candidatus Corynebacterium gallistercoris]
MSDVNRRLLPHPITGELFASPVPPGTGWPEDPATPSTPASATPEDIAARATEARTPDELQEFVSVCAACPRLVQWREELAVTKRAAFADQPYWSRPVPSFGAADSRRVIVGLAPSAHGSNRTGRNFTGDPAGEWLYRALFKAGACTAPRSVAAGDGMELTEARIIPPVHCAPPKNVPSAQEKSTCRLWFTKELELIRPLRILALGQVGWDSVFQAGRQ